MLMIDYIDFDCFRKETLQTCDVVFLFFFLFFFLIDLSILSQNASAERARNILAVETSPTDLVGEQAASQPAPVQPSAINFSLKQWSTEFK